MQSKDEAETPPASERDTALAGMRIVQPRELLREQVLTRLREAIINGVYRPGERLIERELCDALGVSRTSVREVLRLLESERLITVENRRGPVVAEITPDEAAAIYETRAIIEPALVRLFIERASNETIDELLAQAGAFVDAAARRERAALVPTMSAFYECLFRGTGNPVLHSVIENVMARISFLRNTSMSEDGRLERSAGEIRELADALAARDPERAVRAAQTHIENAREAALRQLAAPPVRN